MRKAVTFGLLFVVLVMIFGVSGVALADRAGDQTISGERIDGDVEAAGDIVITDGSRIRGDVEAGGDITISDSRVDGDVEAEGNAVVTDESRIRGDVEAGGGATISDSRVDDDVEAERAVVIEADSRIRGDVDAGGDVVIGEHSEVDGEIDADGDVIDENEDEEAVPELSDLTIAGQGAEATITEGDDEGVSVSVENVGDADGAFEVTVAVGDWTETQATGTIASGDSETVSFEGVTGDLDVGGYDVTASTGDETVTGDLTIQADQEPAFFEVGITGTNSAVTAGETLTVDVTITNTGGEEGTQTVELDAETLGTDSESVTLGGGASTTEQFAIGTGTDDTGEDTVTMRTDDDSDSAQVTVEQARVESALSELDIAGQGAEATITEADEEDVSVTVENVGDAPGSFDVTLAIGDTLGVTENTDELATGEIDTVRFPDVTGGLVADGYTVDISTANDTVTGTLEIQTDEQESEGGNNEQEDEGEREGEQEDEGDEDERENESENNEQEDEGDEDEQDGDSDEGEGGAEQEDQSENSEQESDSDDDAQESDSDEDDREGESENDEQETDSDEDEREGTFEISTPSLSNTVITAGESLEIGLQVENVANEDDTFDTDLLVDGETVDSESVMIEAGGTETIAFSYQFDDPGEYEIAVGDRPLDTVTVTSADEDESETERSGDDATAIEIVQATGPEDWVREGNETSMQVTVENTANRTTNRTFTVTIDDQPVANETVTLQPHERDEVTLGFEATAGLVAVEDVDAGRIDTSETAAEEDTDEEDTEEVVDFDFIVGIVAFLVIVGTLARVTVLEP